MLVMAARTPDGTLRVNVYDDHTAEILTSDGVLVKKRMPVNELDKALAPYGVSGLDLIEG